MSLNICEDPRVLRLLYIFKVFILEGGRIIIPLVLIVALTIDIAKAITSDDVSKKLNAVKKSCIAKFIAAVIVFFIPSIISLTLSLINSNSYKECLDDLTLEKIQLAEKREQEEKEKQRSERNNNNNNVAVDNNAPLNITGEFKEEFTSSNNKTITYWVMVPNNSTTNMPMVFYMHGGSSKNLCNSLTNTELGKITKDTYGDTYPYILLLPCRYGEDSYARLDSSYKLYAELVNHVANKYKVNKGRIAITGVSDGGVGSWQFVSKYPKLFSRFEPVSGWNNGYTSLIDPKELANLPIMGIVSDDTYDSGFKYYMTQYCKKIINSGGKECTVEVINNLCHMDGCHETRNIEPNGSTIIYGDKINGKWIDGAYGKSRLEWLIATSNNSIGNNNNNSYSLSSDGDKILEEALSSFLKKNGSSVEEFNKLLESNISKAGYGTREAVVIAAKTLIGELGDKYNVRIPYYWGGGHAEIILASEKFGGKCPTVTNGETSFNHCGLDCSGLILWSLRNAGFKHVKRGAGIFKDYGGAKKVELSSTTAVLKPGDLLETNGHIALVVSVDNVNKKYICAEAGGLYTGVYFNRRAFNESNYWGVDMSGYYSNANNKIN